MAKSVCVSLSGARSVYREQFQWMYEKTAEPPKTMTVSAFNEVPTLLVPSLDVSFVNGPQDDEDLFD